MEKQIFVNLPVKDLKKSIKFFTKLGFKFNSRFTDKNATCMIISKNIFAMLLVNKFFKSFIPGKNILNASKNTEAIIALSLKNRKEVDSMMNKVKSAGGKEYRKSFDHGWMYGHAFEDLDSHVWEIFYMNKSKMPKEMKNKR